MITVVARGSPLNWRGYPNMENILVVGVQIAAKVSIPQVANAKHRSKQK